MASTSTNKQPLLVDNVLHNVVSLTGATVPKIDDWEITGNSNSAVCIVPGRGSDGAIIEDIYTLSRDTEIYTLIFFLSAEQDYLRQGTSSVVGYFTSQSTSKGEIVQYYDMPYVLAPVPNISAKTQATGNDSENALKYKALYIPRGKSLWVGIAPQPGASSATTTAPATAPYVGVQGGWY